MSDERDNPPNLAEVMRRITVSWLVQNPEGEYVQGDIDALLRGDYDDWPDREDDDDE